MPSTLPDDMLPIIVLLMLKLLNTVTVSLYNLLYCISYCVMIPLGMTGAIHDKITEVGSTANTVSEWGAVPGAGKTTNTW